MSSYDPGAILTTRDLSAFEPQAHLSPKAGNGTSPSPHPGRVRIRLFSEYTTGAAALPTSGSRPQYAPTTCSDRGNGGSLIAAGSPSHRALPGAGSRDGLRRKAHPEPLPPWDDRNDPQAFRHNSAQSPGLVLHYQWRDYAPLRSRPPCYPSLIAAGSPSHSDSPPSPRSRYGVSWVIRARHQARQSTARKANPALISRAGLPGPPGSGGRPPGGGEQR